MQETQVQSLGQDDPPEKEMATHSSILAWSIPWTGTWWAIIQGSQGVGHDWETIAWTIWTIWTIACQAPLSTSSRVCSNSCSLSWSCYLTKSTSIFIAAFLTFWLCVTFWQFSQGFKYFHYYYICHSDLWLVILDVTISKRWQLANGSGWWWLAFFSNKVFLINIKKANILTKWSKTVTI